MHPTLSFGLTALTAKVGIFALCGFQPILCLLPLGLSQCLGLMNVAQLVFSSCLLCMQLRYLDSRARQQPVIILCNYQLESQEWGHIKRIKNKIMNQHICHLTEATLVNCIVMSTNRPKKNHIFCWEVLVMLSGNYGALDWKAADLFFQFQLGFLQFFLEVKA